MKEVSCKLEFNEELWKELEAQMDEFGQIHIPGEEDVVVDVMPVAQKNFVAGVVPVVEIVVQIGSNILMNLLVEWLCGIIKEKSKIIISGKVIESASKESIRKALEEVNNV